MPVFAMGTDLTNLSRSAENGRICSATVKATLLAAMCSHSPATPGVVATIIGDGTLVPTWATRDGSNIVAASDTGSPRVASPTSSSTAPSVRNHPQRHRAAHQLLRNEHLRATDLDDHLRPIQKRHSSPYGDRLQRNPELVSSSPNRVNFAL
jgi:hypothetical protein